MGVQRPHIYRWNSCRHSNVWLCAAPGQGNLCHRTKQTTRRSPQISDDGDEPSHIRLGFTMDLDDRRGLGEARRTPACSLVHCQSVGAAGGLPETPLSHRRRSAAEGSTSAPSFSIVTRHRQRARCLGNDLLHRLMASLRVCGSHRRLSAIPSFSRRSLPVSERHRQSLATA